MIAKLELTQSDAQQNIEQLQNPTMVSQRGNIQCEPTTCIFKKYEKRNTISMMLSFQFL